MNTSSPLYTLVERDFSGNGHLTVCMMNLDDFRIPSGKFIGHVVRVTAGGVADNGHLFRIAITQQGEQYQVFADRSCRAVG